MKFRITFKDPDGVGNAIQEAAREAAMAVVAVDADLPLLVERREEEINEFIKQWVDYSEYLTVEFDTEARTAVVVRA